MQSLQGKVAVITGGSGALGRAVSRKLVDAGVRIVVTYILEREVVDLRAVLADGTYELARVDLGDAGAVGKVVTDVVDRYGRIDILLNLAGGFWGGVPFTETPEAELDRMLAMNLKTAYVASQAVLPVMLRQRSGRIVNVTARPALTGGAYVSAYAASKAAVAALTRALADEVREQGITVNAIAPSTIDTPANRVAMPDADPSRWVTVDQIAGTLLFLASDAAAATSGAIIPIYGRA
jgi:NAD(P)-dependent dehydrogenase (short-subunit alcohol dehydrogenase family)